MATEATLQCNEQEIRIGKGNDAQARSYPTKSRQSLRSATKRCVKLNLPNELGQCQHRPEIPSRFDMPRHAVDLH